MEIIKTNYFKSNLTKQQIQDLAKDEAERIIQSSSALDYHIILKKANLFLTTLLRANEKNALLEWDQSDKQFYINVSYNQGGEILDHNEFEYRKQIAEHLKEVDNAIKRASKSKEPQFCVNIITGEILEVPKVKIKSYRKESLNVKI